MVALTCTGAPSGAACSISPATVTLSGTTAATATVTVTTKAASLVWLSGATERFRRIKPIPLFVYGLAYTLALLVIATLYQSRAEERVPWAPVLAMTLLLCVGLMVSSCGGGSSGGGGGGSGATGTQPERTRSRYPRVRRGVRLSSPTARS
jgi:hypothetical protein